jgi:transaldolase/glucose-6-phosphate isomerase
MYPSQRLGDYGQSIWLDYIRRSLLCGGKLEQMIREDGLAGMTSNPSIFEKAIAGSGDYSAELQELAQQPGITTLQVYEQLALGDIRSAAGQLRPVFDASARRDGYVSIEVSPHLANDTQGTVAEARRLWETLDLPNIMIKVPATEAGLPAIQTLLAEGININVTLLFSVAMYERVADTYLCALEQRLAAGSDPGTVASVASFFISRIDSAIDNQLDARITAGPDEEQRAGLEQLRGQAAIASARLAYQRYRILFGDARWQALAGHGAHTQRLLWASTSVKNPAYRDVRYIEELIGPDTVTTVPPATLDAFRDHGVPRASLEEDGDVSLEVIRNLERVGISLETVTDALLQDGVRKFTQAYDKLLAAIESQLAAVTGVTGESTQSLPAGLAAAVEQALDDWQRNDKSRRLWARDAGLWTGADEARWMDWLGVTARQMDHIGDLRRLAERVAGHNFRFAVLLGMGGSSMAPEVIRETLGTFPGHPDLRILDSTDPAQVRTVEDGVDLAHTLFLVASKSGSTLEPAILQAYFYQRMCETVGAGQAPAHFLAVTDPGSDLERLAVETGFRRVFHGVPGIGGRYSALSNFGLVPAAVLGVDVERFLDRAMEMVEACAACVPVRENPGVVLGCILGVAATQSRDKLTLIASPGIASLGAWLEQLVAESTGKQGRGIIPVEGEEPGNPAVYGDDRVFVYVRLENAPDAAQDVAVQQLEAAGQPVVRIPVTGPGSLGQEFFRWEIATAVAGSLLGINPFDQPDVEASKVETRKLTSEYETRGNLPVETPLAEGDGLILYTDPRNAAELRTLAGGDVSVGDLLKAHLGRTGAGDYVALLAYLSRNAAHHQALQAMRHRIRDRWKVATCVGFGPRFLHSTGQAYKGGPNNGVFLQITCEDAVDLPVPGHGYTFGVVKAAQARGDFEVLVERGRRALRVHLGPDTVQGLQQLDRLVAAACDT